MFPSSVFLPNQRQVKVEVGIHAKDHQADIHALLDSGATDNFVCPAIVKHFNLPIYTLPDPKIIRNVDGTKNSIGSIHTATNLTVKYDGNEVLQRFFIIELGGDSMLLGMPFLAAHNPDVNWSKGQLEGKVSAHTADAHLWTPHRQHHYLRFLHIEARDRERTTEVPNIGKEVPNIPTYWPLSADVHSRRVTRATELAIDAADKAAAKEKIPWHLQVPLEYHRYKTVFSEEEAKRFPASWPWDHAIELLPDAPDTLDCKVYPLAPAEQDTLNKFIKDHLNKGYIHKSNSPYASPFFFIKKQFPICFTILLH